jgi:HlyD family secretion protein
VKRLALIAGVVLAVGLVGWWLARPEPVSVELAAVDRGTVEATVVNTRAGTVDACRRAGLSPAQGGQIAELPVKEGEHVAAGQLLLELWNEDLRAQLGLAQRDAAAAQSRANEACIVSDNAGREADRLMRLHEQRLASEEAADQAQSNAAARAAACQAGRDAAQSAAAQADVVTAQIDRTRLVAPFDGVIAEINGEIGEFVTPSPVGIPTPPTIDLIDSTCLYISAPIDEVDAPRIATGMPARISLDAFPGRVFPGHVRRIAPYVLDVEKQARTVEVEAQFDHPESDTLLPGYSADVEVILDKREDAIRVPTAVILPGDVVYVYDGAASRIEARKIERGLSNFEYTEVVRGLEPGDRVVRTVDREGVADGALVRVE